jgi:hypothetical protein
MPLAELLLLTSDLFELLAVDGIQVALVAAGLPRLYRQPLHYVGNPRGNTRQEGLMTQTTINRRKALAVVAAVPAIAALGGVPALTAKISGDDKLIELIQLYRAHIDAICEECRNRDMDDEELGCADGSR